MSLLAGTSISLHYRQTRATLVSSLTKLWPSSRIDKLLLYNRSPSIASKLLHLQLGRECYILRPVYHGPDMPRSPFPRHTRSLAHAPHVKTMTGSAGRSGGVIAGSSN